jgi:hypothetical protein
VLQIQKEYISLHPATEINNGLFIGKKVLKLTRAGVLLTSKEVL